MELNYKDLVRQLKSCVFTVINPELAGNAATAIQFLAERLAYYEDLEEQGRLIILTAQDIHPCRNCDTGWGSISSEGSDGCENYCVRLKEYNEKYND